MHTTITIRSQEGSDGLDPRVFFVVQSQAEKGLGGGTELFPCPPDTVAACPVLQRLVGLPGDSPFPYPLKSFRFWLCGLESSSAPRSYEASLGAVEVRVRRSVLRHDVASMLNATF